MLKHTYKKPPKEPIEPEAFTPNSFLTINEAAELYNLKPCFLRKDIARYYRDGTRHGPKFVRIGGHGNGGPNAGRIRYRIRDIEAWVDSLTETTGKP